MDGNTRRQARTLKHLPKTYVYLCLGSTTTRVLPADAQPEVDAQPCLTKAPKGQSGSQAHSFNTS